MKSIQQVLSTGVAALLFTAAAHAVPVDLNIDGSAEGLALDDLNQSTLNAGVIEFGWLNAGTTEAQIIALFNAQNLAGIDSLFNQVGTITFSLGSANTFGNGAVYESVALVSDHTNAAAFSAYKDPTTGAAGKQGFLWIRDSASLGSTTRMAFVDANSLFPTANDLVGFSDFGNTFATDSFTINNSHVWVGSIETVQFNGGIDLNGGSMADGTGLNGGTSTLELATVVPEPSTAVLALMGLAGLGLRRRRQA